MPCRFIDDSAKDDDASDGISNDEAPVGARDGNALSAPTVASTDDDQSSQNSSDDDFINDEDEEDEEEEKGIKIHPEERCLTEDDHQLIQENGRELLHITPERQAPTSSKKVWQDSDEEDGGESDEGFISDNDDLLPPPAARKKPRAAPAAARAAPAAAARAAPAAARSVVTGSSSLAGSVIGFMQRDPWYQDRADEEAPAKLFPVFGGPPTGGRPRAVAVERPFPGGGRVRPLQRGRAPAAPFLLARGEAAPPPPAQKKQPAKKRDPGSTYVDSSTGRAFYVDAKGQARRREDF